MKRTLIATSTLALLLLVASDGATSTCPSWAFCTPAPGPGSQAMFASWVQNQLGVTTPAQTWDGDSDGNDDPPGGVIVDENGKEVGTIVLTDWEEQLVLGPSTNHCPSCNPAATVLETPSPAEQDAVWEGTIVGNPGVVMDRTTGVTAGATIADIAEVDHGHGHSSYQVLLTTAFGSYRAVMTTRSAYLTAQ